MKKINLNRKGFMMAELLAVTVLVLIIFIVIYTNFVTTKGEYEKRIEYYDVDSMYANFYLKMYLLKKYNGTSPTLSNGYVDIITNSRNCKFKDNIDGYTCEKLRDEFNIQRAIITKYKPDSSYNGPLKTYINSLDVKTLSYNDEVYRLTIVTDTGYASDQLFVTGCGDTSSSSYDSWIVGGDC